MTALPTMVRRALARNTPLQRRVERHLTLPRLERRETVPGQVWGITLVRDEIDVIGHAIKHLLHQGAHYVLAVDNLSTDGTADLLQELAATDPRILVGYDALGEHYQGRKMSAIANRVRLAGAEWIIPFDADEFWFARSGTLTDYLAGVRTHQVVRAHGTNAYPTQYAGIDLEDPDAVVSLAPQPMMGKVAIRPTRWVWIDDGNHSALDLGKPTLDGLSFIHIPYRSYSQMERKFRQGAAALAAAKGVAPHIGHHWRESAAQSEETLRRRWASLIAENRDSVSSTPNRWASWPEDFRSHNP
ncbi:glycosyltransferase family 2 protein [Tessaracoccus lapidicaptus]|uniref:glycosyltransferase family 2 protein n=1 Tax=Tessaracoccus lapidicaptus TaxID=1427523 RepID=UPI0033401E79